MDKSPHLSPVPQCSISCKYFFSISPTELCIRMKYVLKLAYLSSFHTKVSMGAKIRNQYNQVPHLTQDTKSTVFKLCRFSVFGRILFPDYVYHIIRLCRF